MHENIFCNFNFNDIDQNLCNSLNEPCNVGMIQRCERQVAHPVAGGIVRESEDPDQDGFPVAGVVRDQKAAAVKLENRCELFFGT